MGLTTNTLGEYMGKRMYYIFKIIQEQGIISAKDIVKELENYDIYIDVKTVYRLIQHINDFFFEWVDGEIIMTLKKKGYMIGKELFLDGELQFLLDSLYYHQDINEDDASKLKRKLSFLSSSFQQEHITTLSYTHDHSFSLIHNLTLIMKAIQNEKVLSFQYIDYDVYQDHFIEVPSHQGQLYYVSPYQVVSNNNHYYLIGYNPKHQDTLSTYRIDRMRVIQTTHQPFMEMREQFQMKEEIEKMMNMFTSQNKETLQIQGNHRVIREIVSRFGKDIHVKKLYHQQYLITIEDVPISDGLIGWLMMLQNHVQVIAPQSLRETMKERLNLMNELYQDVL